MHKLSFPRNKFLTALFTFCLCRHVYSQDDCSQTWTVYQGMNVPGGTLVSDVNTLSLCKSTCISNSKCTGIDFDGANQCWLILISSAALKKNSSNFVSHYDLGRNASLCNSLCIGGEPVTGWQVTANAHVINGKSSTETTIDTCLKKCLSQKTCNGIDWDINGESKCWIVENNNPVQQDAPNVDHYQKLCSEVKGIVTTFPAGGGSSGVPAITRTPPPALLSGQYDAGVAVDYVVVEAHAIKPAYIVLAGLGGGCILLVIIAIIVICNYPLRKKGSGGGTKILRKTKIKSEPKPKTKKLHTARPKTLGEEEEIHMNTISNGSTSYNQHNSYNDIKERNSAAESNHHVEPVSYVGVDHDSRADRYSNRESSHSDHNSQVDYNSHADRESTLEHKHHTEEETHIDEDDQTAYNTLTNNERENPYYHKNEDNAEDHYDENENRDENYD